MDYPLLGEVNNVIVSLHDWVILIIPNLEKWLYDYLISYCEFACGCQKGQFAAFWSSLVLKTLHIELFIFSIISHSFHINPINPVVTGSLMLPMAIKN